MARHRIKVFSISLLDTLFCAFGGVIVLMVLFSAMISEQGSPGPPPGLGMVTYLRYDCNLTPEEKAELSNLTRRFLVEFMADTMPVLIGISQDYDIISGDRRVGRFQGNSRNTIRGTDPLPVVYSYSCGTFRFEDYSPDSLLLLLTGIGTYDARSGRIPSDFRKKKCFKLAWIIYEPGFPPVEHHEFFTWDELNQRKIDEIPLAISRTDFSQSSIEIRYQFSRP